MILFPVPYFFKMAQYVDAFRNRRVTGFHYNREKRIVKILFDRCKEAIYIDLTHPYTSFFVTDEKIPLPFGEKDVGIKGGTLRKLKLLEGDRVLYLLFEKNGDFRVIAMELTGKASYVLIIDNNGKVVFKYPPHRKRQRGGDVGQEYVPPQNMVNINLKRYFGDLIEDKTLSEVVSIFLSADKFYTDGRIIWPYEWNPSEPCGNFKNCFFRLYLKDRFLLDREDLSFMNESVPYFIYYKAAGLLKNKIIPASREINIDGYRIDLPPFSRSEEIIDFLLKTARLMQARSVSEKTNDSSVLTYTAPSGYKVLVGRNAKDNNRITFNIAHGKDMFFHVKDYPGAHVVLQNNGMRVEKDDILYCASLAKYHSKARGKDRVDVLYTEVRYVKPVRGIPGRVILLKEKVIRL